MIIDSHVHIGKTEKTERFWTLNSYTGYMDSHGISKAVVMPNVSSEIPFADLNHDLLTEYLVCYVQSRYNLLYLIDIHDTLQQIERYSEFVSGLKYHPSVLQVSADDARFYKWVDIALEKNWPILVHCGRDPMSHIQHLVNVAKKVPQVKLIAAHMGGNASDLIEKAITCIKEERVDNIYLDTSNGKLPWLIEKAVNDLGAERILFGSDEPYADMWVAKYLIDLSDISTGAKESIFYKNVERLYRRQLL